jgi:hypothetical protein
VSNQLVDLLARTPERPRTVLGRAANTVTQPSDDLYVTIGAFDGHRQQWGPCDWAPAEALPTRGDDVLVLFDEDERPWVVVFTFGSRTTAGVVASPAPSSSTDPLYVTVDGIRIGPMPWAPREVIPAVGDSMLVFFDEDGQASAIAFTLPPPAPPQGLGLIAHVDFTADVPFTATVEASAVIVAQLPSANYNGNPVMLDFFAPRVDSAASSGQTYYISLFRDGAVLVGRWGAMLMNNAIAWQPRLGYRDTPAAGSHTYSARVYSTSGNGGTVRAGTGGATTLGPGYLRARYDT